MIPFLGAEGEMELLTLGWQMAEGTPETAAAWLPAQVPGTVAGALTRAGLFSPEAPTPLHDRHFCYSRTLKGSGKYRLCFDGLATFADVYLDGALVLSSRNMFHRHSIEVTLNGAHRLLLHFAPLSEAMAQSKPRARWRTRMIANAGARHVRTTLLGQMPGWCPSIESVGPWREIRLVKADVAHLEQPLIQTKLQGHSGVLEVSFLALKAQNLTLHCAGHSAPFAQKQGRAHARLLIPHIKPWWPHTHGEPALYPAHVELEGQTIPLGNVGFRTIALDRGADGKDFKLEVNGTPVFCRGAVWTNADLLNLSGSRATYEPLLRRARDLGMNMLRMSGTGAYESRAFYDLCAELGILIWQDFMFANFDYPIANAEFAASCAKEAHDFLEQTMGTPALAVLCGGSEMLQQAAMMGLPAESWPQDISHTILPEAATHWRPDLPYVVNSPSGGPLPFIVNEGVTHYYGVGAYKRPLDDARRANVRFATECLAFSQLPDGPLDPTSPDWKRTVPQDRGTDWDFEDTRDHYLETIFNIQSNALRASDPALWLHASRAITGHVMETTFAEWRRDGSSCNGALVWTYQDLQPGLGWGIVNPGASPKPAAFALKRAFKPQAVFLTDEGCNGLTIHLINERPQPLNARLELSCLQDNGLPVIHETRDILLAPNSKICLSSAELVGSFYDISYAYRFGPPGHYATVARLLDEAGNQLSEAFHFPQFAPLQRREIGFTATLESNTLTLQSEAFLHFVRIASTGFEAEDNWFHLPPGQPRTLRLTRLKSADSTIEVSALNSTVKRSLQAT